VPKSHDASSFTDAGPFSMQILNFPSIGILAFMASGISNVLSRSGSRVPTSLEDSLRVGSVLLLHPSSCYLPFFVSPSLGVVSGRLYIMFPAILNLLISMTINAQFLSEIILGTG